MSIKTIKLVTGEDVMAEYNETNGDVTLTNPVQITLVPTRNSNQPNFGFVPFPLTSSDKQITINKSHILFVAEPAEDFLNQYNSIFGAGIITPPKGLII